MALTTRNRFSRFFAALYESAVPSRDCHVGRWPPRNDKPLVFAILTAACFLRRCSAGPGCPLPYNTACGRRWLVRAASAFPRLPRRFAPRNDKSGNLHGRRNCFKICNCQWRSLSAATDAIGFYRFNGSLYGSFVQRRARLSAPLQRQMRSAECHQTCSLQGGH